MTKNTVRPTIHTLLILPFLLFAGSCADIGSDPSDTSGPVAPDQEGLLYDVAGIAGVSGSGGDGGQALKATLSFPEDVAVLFNGDVLIVDAENNCIRKVAPDGMISRSIGSGHAGDGTNGRPPDIDLEDPSSLTIGPTGELWIAGWRNCKVKMMDVQGSSVTSPIGTTMGFAGDGGPAIYSQLNLPSSMIFDTRGNMYISDQANQRIRKVDVNMTITTFVGSGVKGWQDGEGDQAQFSFPSGANAVQGGRISWAHHPDGLLIADTENHRIRSVNLETRQVFTVCGTGQPGNLGDGGTALQAQLNYPTDVYLSDDHEIFIADSRNNVIRMINAVGFISTVVGTGIPGSSPNGTVATAAKLNNPTGLFFVESTRELYIADRDNHQVKKVKLPR